MTTTTLTAGSSRDEGLLGVLRRGNLGVVVVAGLLLVGGWFLRGRALASIARFESKSVVLEHPAGWLDLGDPTAGKDREATLVDAFGSGAFRARIALSREKQPAELKEQELSSYLQLNLQQGHTLFHLVREQAVRVDGRSGIRIDYAYAVNPAARPDDPAATDVPIVVHASTLALVTRDGAIVRVTVEEPASPGRERSGLADRVLGSVRLRSAGGQR
jgi:hypothetical protein